MAALIALPGLRARAIISMLPEILKQSCEQEAYKTYVAECLRMATENTAKFAGGRYMSISFGEMLHPKPVDTRTGEEVIAHMKGVLKGLEKGGEGQ